MSYVMLLIILSYTPGKQQEILDPQVDDLAQDLESRSASVKHQDRRGCSGDL
jgi:hypothetical protein